MGHMRHHAIIVSSCFGGTIQEVHGAARFLFKKNVTDLTEPVVNGYRSFLIAPDGSKEGWDESEEGNKKRDEFIEHLKTYCYEDGSSPLDWAEVQFGDGDGENKILRTDDDQIKEG